ncbi:MAG TPA: PAS domain S-box protein, partial [Methylomirabilota bacterium]|nr:PAS domain S-box protein [Methylomirabilota bacterium]
MRTEATPLRVLILEDNPDHAELIVHQLRRAGFIPEWRRVETEQDYLKSLDAAPSLILADYHLPRFNALHALDLTRARGLETPFIVVSGLITEEAAAECLKRGANDYLLKDRLARLGQAITNALEKQQVQANLRRAEEVQAELAAIVESSDDAIVSTELDGTIVSWNRGAERMYGYSVAEMIGRNISVLTPAERADEIQRNIGKLKTGARIDHFETVRVRKDGQRVDISITIFPLKDAAAVITGMGAITRDITGKKRAEKLLQEQREALMQAEKLAAMGSLLAGVAHELNNPLAIVSAHLYLLQQSVGGGPLAERVKKIIDATERCAQLVRTCTALARQDPPERRPVKLDQIAQEAVRLLTYQLQVDSVEVTTDLADDLTFLWADTNQLHQVIINVLSNAHQAVRECPLPRRIRLTIRFDPSRSRVTLEVADNGPG